MDDLISRQAAIDAIESSKDKTAKGDIGGFYNAIIQNDIDKLRNLPSAEPEQRWIPVTEGLPHDKDYDETFIVTIQCEHVDGWDDYVTGYADWTPHGWDIQSYYLGQIKVVAWMPLPEPYREDEE